jgi:ABC-type antimicrobial peptide transport system permease subunit
VRSYDAPVPVPFASSLDVVLLGVLAAVGLLFLLAHFTRIPYPIWLTVGGATLGFVPGMPAVELEPELVLVLFLPPLLTSAAYYSSIRDLRFNARPIALLSIGLVLVTTAGVAFVAHHLVGMPWEAAFVLGAVLGPTDPVAATAIAGRVGAPRRVVTVLEGESLVNDATALIAFRFAVAAVVTGSFSLVDAVGDFGKGIVGGIAIGIAVGALAGFYGGAGDTALMRVTEAFQTLPNFLLLLLLVAVFGSDLRTITVGIGLVSWPPVARLTRAEFLTLRTREFVQAARLQGLGDAHLILREVLPNALPPVLVYASVVMAVSILLESALSFLQLSDPNVPSWGNLIGLGRNVLRTEWYVSAIPGVAILLTILGVSLVGQGLNDALNPRLAGGR